MEGERLVPAKFTNSNKRADGILVDENSYEYRMKSVRGIHTYWVCRESKEKNCGSRATTVVVGENIFVKSIQMSF